MEPCFHHPIKLLPVPPATTLGELPAVGGATRSGAMQHDMTRGGVQQWRSKRLDPG